MSSEPNVGLTELEPSWQPLFSQELRQLLQTAPASIALLKTFEHLRSLHHILRQYVPEGIATDPPLPGVNRCHWQEGTLLFTDLVGFTPLLEAGTTAGQAGTNVLWYTLNRYFAIMLEIISKSGGDLLEFTGDAMLVQFLADRQQSDLARAVRAGLRMQRAMSQFEAIALGSQRFSLQMRVGIHHGCFATADIGTTQRMTRIVLGHSLQQAKQAEGASPIGRVCLTQSTADRLSPSFHLESIPLQPTHQCIIDDLSEAALGEYDIALKRRRTATPLLVDRSPAGLTEEIETIVAQLQPLVTYLPKPILELIVEHVAQRQIPARVVQATVMFVNLVGLSEASEQALPSEMADVTAHLSRLFSEIEAIVTTWSGVLKDAAYHLDGSNLLIYFGVTQVLPDAAFCAVQAACAIRSLITTLPPLTVAGATVSIGCRIGLAQGDVFAAEIGEPRGRREFNVLGDPVNTAARLKSRAEVNQIFLTEAVYQTVQACGRSAQPFPLPFNALGSLNLKGKATSTFVFTI